MSVSFLYQPRKIPASSGSVLLALLCVVAVLSFLIVSTAMIAHQHGEQQQARFGMIRARQLAEMGVAVAAHPQIKAGDPLLRRVVSGVERYEALVSTEEARLNLNALLTEQGLPVLERVFTSWGVPVGDAQAIATILMDWVDADDLKLRPDSAEKLDYDFQGLKGIPFNRPFQNLDEVDLVPRMMEITEIRPDWRSFFTLRGSGRLDVNSASAEVLAAATGAGVANAEQLVQRRNGLDGLPQTEDDLPLQSLEEAMALLGLSGQDAQAAAEVLTLTGQTKRIESIGTAGDVRCGIAVILNPGGGGIAEWSELSLEESPQL